MADRTPHINPTSLMYEYLLISNGKSTLQVEESSAETVCQNCVVNKLYRSVLRSWCSGAGWFMIDPVTKMN